MEIVRRSPIYVKRRKVLVSYRHYYSSREASNPLTHLMKYAVPTVLALLILKYQKKPKALFRDNPVQVWCFVAATGVYWLIVGATKQRMWDQKLRCAALAFGILSALSLLSMFLHYPASLLPLLIWMPLPLLLTWPAAGGWILRRITTVIGQIQAMVVRARGGAVSTNKPPILPV